MVYVFNLCSYLLLAVYHNPLEINPKEMAWSRMSPQLQCSKDQMKFTATGPGSSLLAVEQKQGC